MNRQNTNLLRFHARLARMSNVSVLFVHCKISTKINIETILYSRDPD